MLSSDYKLIFNNSIFLYAKLFISTLVGLYVARVVLAELGANDFGLYSVVGGIVYMMNFLNVSMISTTNRFISVELGKQKKSNVGKVFNTSLIINFGFALLLILIAETLGVYFIKNYLNINPTQVPDAIFVMHFSVLASIFSILSLPFQGLIIAHEKFKTAAIVEILVSLSKLMVAVSLTLYLGNKLRLYSILMALTFLFSFLLYLYYCLRKYRNYIKFKFNNIKSDYIKMISFSNWMLFGTIAQISIKQGGILIINLFFGTIINASFGIANQIYNYMTMFVQNINQAAVPQIMKIQSSGQEIESVKIVYYISKYSFFLILIPSIPLLLSIDYFLQFWLKDVPFLTLEFTVLLIINTLIASLGSSLGVPVHASGDIRKTQFWYGIILLSVIPLSLIFFKLNFPAYYLVVIMIFATIVNIIAQLIITQEKTNFRKFRGS